MAFLLAAISHSSSHVALAHNMKLKKIHQSQCRTLPLPHRSPICRYTSLFLHYFFQLVSRESWSNQYINLSLFFLTSLFLLAWISSFLSANHDHNLGWGVARRAIRFAELWGFRIRFRQVAYLGVLLLWLGFRVGLKLELGVGLLLWLGFRVGLK